MSVSLTSLRRRLSSSLCHTGALIALKIHVLLLELQFYCLTHLLSTGFLAENSALKSALVRIMLSLGTAFVNPLVNRQHVVQRQSSCNRQRLFQPVFTQSRMKPRASFAPASEEQTGANALLSSIKRDAAGLVVAVAQQWDTGEVLMVAWMNDDAIRATIEEGRAVYYSRSRKRLWRKGEESGNVQNLRELLVDCDGDSILLKVDQRGPACHTGRPSCFYTTARNGQPLTIVTDPVEDPAEMYRPK